MGKQVNFKPATKFNKGNKFKKELDMMGAFIEKMQVAEEIKLLKQILFQVENREVVEEDLKHIKRLPTDLYENAYRLIYKDMSLGYVVKSITEDNFSIKLIPHEPKPDAS